MLFHTTSNRETGSQVELDNGDSYSRVYRLIGLKNKSVDLTFPSTKEKNKGQGCTGERTQRFVKSGRVGKQIGDKEQSRLYALIDGGHFNFPAARNELASPASN